MRNTINSEYYPSYFANKINVLLDRLFNQFPTFMHRLQNYFRYCCGTRKRVFTVVLLLLIFSMPGFVAAESTKSSRLYEDALVQYQKKNYKAAIINLKNAIHENSKHLAAHILLGQSYLADKQLTAAEYEFKQAEQLGADKSSIIVSRAELYLSQLKSSQLLKEIDPGRYNAGIRYELHLYRGHAHLQLNQPIDAIKEYEAAAKLDPEQAAPITGKANALLLNGQLKEAALTAQLAIQKAPDNVDAINALASVYHAQNDLFSALKEYDKVIGIDPDNLDARTARAGIYIDVHKNDQAASDLQYLRKIYPSDAKSAYLNAIILDQNNQKDSARKELETAAAVLDGIKPEILEQHSPSLMLAGLVNFSLGRFQKATTYLKKYIALFPRHPGPYKLLASIMLEHDQSGQVIELLEPGLKYAGNDYKFLLLLSTAYMQNGQRDKANAMLQRASSLKENNDNIHTELGMSRLMLGQEDLAIKEFESAVKANPEDTAAGIKLALMYIKRGEAKKALNVAEAMHKHEPKNLTLLNLLGSAQATAGQKEKARISFENAISLDPEAITAYINLSKLDLADKKFNEVEQRLLMLNQKFPKDISLMVDLAQLYSVQQNYPEALMWLNKAKELNAKSLPVILATVDNHLKSGKYPEALRVANEGLEIFPNNFQLLDALARSYTATGNKEKATATYQGMVRDAGFNEKRLFEIARQQTALEDYRGAIKSLKIAVQANPEFLPARIALTELQLYHGEKIFALNEAQSIIEQFPDKSIGNRLLGDIDNYDKKYAQAAAYYQIAFDKEPDSDILMRLYMALTKANEQAKAFQLLEQWVGKHPADSLPVQALAEEYLKSGELEKAKKYYEIVLRDNKNQPNILNNLANIYWMTGDAKALIYAEQAQQMAPDLPTVNDTLGWILVNKGQPERGLEFLRNAHSLSSQDPEIRYHIAVALDKLNRSDEAKSELEQLFKEKQTFSGIEEARALLAKLKK